MNDDGIAFLPRNGRSTPPGYKKILFCDPGHPQYESDERLGKVPLYKLVPADYDETQEALNEKAWEYDDDDYDSDGDHGVCYDHQSFYHENLYLLPPKQDQALSSLYFGGPAGMCSMRGTLPTVSAELAPPGDATLYLGGSVDAEPLGVVLPKHSEPGARDSRALGYVGVGERGSRKETCGAPLGAPLGTGMASFSSIGSGCDSLETRVAAADANFWASSASGAVRAAPSVAAGGNLGHAWGSVGAAARESGGARRTQGGVAEWQEPKCECADGPSKRAPQGRKGRPRRMKFAEYVMKNNGAAGAAGKLTPPGPALSSGVSEQYLPPHVYANAQVALPTASGPPLQAIPEFALDAGRDMGRCELSLGGLRRGYEEGGHEANAVETTLEEMPPGIRRVFEPILGGHRLDI